MAHRHAHLSDVFYNAATQSFEGLVTLSSGRQTYRYACAIEAPITMSFEDAAAGLRKQAERKHRKTAGLRSETRHHIPRTRNGRNRFDPVSWLSALITQEDKRAA